MIKFLAHSNGRPMIGLGLSRGNCERLLEGRPIFIDMKVMLGTGDIKADLNESTIFIFGGEDEESMKRILEEGLGELPEPKTHYDEN